MNHKGSLKAGKEKAVAVQIKTTCWQKKVEVVPRCFLTCVTQG